MKKYAIGYGFSTGAICDRMVRGGADTLKAAKLAARNLDTTYFWGRPQIARVDGEQYTYICSVRPINDATVSRTGSMDPSVRVIVGDTML